MMRVTRIRKPCSFRPVYLVGDLSKASRAHRFRCVFAIIASVPYLFFVLLRLIDPVRFLNRSQYALPRIKY
jgi:hypothetical protein